MAYEWAWTDSVTEEVTEAMGNVDGSNDDSHSNDDSDSHSNHCHSNEDSDRDELDLNQSFVTHTVNFKCMGANRDNNHQITLEAAAKLIAEGKDVPVRLTPEPNKPRDSDAIAFQCYVDNNWGRVGYVVKEILPEWHDAILS